MRAILLTALFALMLVAPVALADRGDDERERSGAARAAHQPDHDDDDNETREHANRTERHAWRENWTANRTAALASLRENITSIHASWLENATKVREACHNATLDRDNATKEQRKEFSHCIRDGYADWRETHRAKLDGLREAFHKLLRGWGWHHKGQGSD